MDALDDVRQYTKPLIPPSTPRNTLEPLVKETSYGPPVHVPTLLGLSASESTLRDQPLGRVKVGVTVSEEKPEANVKAASGEVATEHVKTSVAD